MTKRRNETGGLARRDVLASGAAGLAAPLLVGGPAAAQESGAGLQIPEGANYDRVPLAKDTIRIGMAQTRITMVDPDNPDPIRQSNLQFMLDWVDRVQDETKHDLVMFHELPLTGLSLDWSREQVQRCCIEVPGPESEAIAAKAKEHACYITFGAYVRDADWPNHNLSLTTIIGPDGAIIDRQWKVRNIKGALGGIELMTTTIYNVYDEYVERYGLDQVIPVARTPIGNICTTAAQREPEIYRAQAIKGCEILLRTATGVFRLSDIQGACLHNGFYSAMVNNAYIPNMEDSLRRRFGEPMGREPLSDTATVLSTIVGPGGEVIAQASSAEEQLVSAEIPIAAFRAQYEQPMMHWALYEPVYTAYRPKYPPNMFSGALPDSSDEVAAFLEANKQW